MAHTNILSRRLNRECINLGFSGNAFLDYEVAEVMAAVDAGAYVLDFVPNVTVEQMEERMETFIVLFEINILIHLSSLWKILFSQVLTMIQKEQRVFPN